MSVVFDFFSAGAAKDVRETRQRGETKNDCNELCSPAGAKRSTPPKGSLE